MHFVKVIFGGLDQDAALLGNGKPNKVRSCRERRGKLQGEQRFSATAVARVVMHLAFRQPAFNQPASLGRGLL